MYLKEFEIMNQLINRKIEKKTYIYNERHEFNCDKTYILMNLLC